MERVEAYKTIKVPLWVYANAKQVELALIRKGLELLPPEILQPQQCPICKSQLEAFQSKGERDYVRCPHCGYTQPRFAKEAGEGVMLSTAIGMGLVYLLNALFGNGHHHQN